MRLKLVIAYTGAGLQGWQSQAGGNTVQDWLQAAFTKIEGSPVIVYGAGRTDTGVHATAQCAHVDVTKPGFTAADWLRALNGNLPEQIRIVRSSRAAAGFHARFSAIGKIYTYRIWNAPIFSPFEIGRAWHLPGSLEIGELKAAAKLLRGTHDFGAFAANRGKPDENTVRTIHDIRVSKRGPLVTLTFSGNGFLYRMVRLLTGSMVRCAQGKAPLCWIEQLLRGEQKSSFAAPAEGLCLTRVLYR